MNAEVRLSFVARMSGGYVSTCQGGYVSCPPYVIAAAASRARPGKVELPDGYTLETLEDIRWITGSLGAPVPVSPRQARELAQIGEQLLRAELDPPLDPLQRESIQHLLDLVGADCPG